MLKSQNMSETLHIALVGAGLAGRQHALAIGECRQTTLSAIVDPAAAAKEYAQAQNVAWYASLADMLSQHRPDGIVLATPNNRHVADALECLNHQCPVLVEKPVATSTEEGEALLTAVDKTPVPLLVGHHRRHNPLAQKARDIITSGGLGEVRAVHGVCWLYKPDDYFEKEIWRTQPGAGPVAVNLIHDIDLLRYFCGDVESVQAQTAPSKRGHDNEDVAAVILRFANGVLATLNVSDTIASPWSWEWTAGENPAYPKTEPSCYHIGGTHGGLSIPDMTLWENNGIRSWWEPLTPRQIAHDAAEPLVRQMQHFAEVIQEKAEPLVSCLEGMKTLQVAEAIHHSAVSGDTVQLPPLK